MHHCIICGLADEPMTNNQGTTSPENVLLHGRLEGFENMLTYFMPDLEIKIH